MPYVSEADERAIVSAKTKLNRIKDESKLVAEKAMHLGSAAAVGAVFGVLNQQKGGTATAPFMVAGKAPLDAVPPASASSAPSSLRKGKAVPAVMGAASGALALYGARVGAAWEAQRMSGASAQPAAQPAATGTTTQGYRVGPRHALSPIRRRRQPPPRRSTVRQRLRRRLIEAESPVECARQVCGREPRSGSRTRSRFSLALLLRVPVSTPSQTGAVAARTPWGTARVSGPGGDASHPRRSSSREWRGPALSNRPVGLGLRGHERAVFRKTLLSGIRPAGQIGRRAGFALRVSRARLERGGRERGTLKRLAGEAT